MKIFYSPSYTIAAHSFETTRKSRWIAESLAREPISGIELVAPEPTSAAALGRVHDPEYVDAVRNGSPRELAESQDFRWDPALWEMACSSNGGVVAAAIEALRTRRVSGSLSSGLHHARRARGKGYCTFNGLVLAACAALDVGASTVLILDLDAHCGGGTHELIDGEERIWQMDVSVDAFDHYEPLGNNQLEMVHDASRYSGIDQVARRFRRRVGGGSADPERSQSVIVAPHDPKGGIGTVGQLEPAAEEGRH